MGRNHRRGTIRTVIILYDEYTLYYTLPEDWYAWRCRSHYDKQTAPRARQTKAMLRPQPIPTLRSFLTRVQYVPKSIDNDRSPEQAPPICIRFRALSVTSYLAGLPTFQFYGHKKSTHVIIKLQTQFITH